MTTRSEEANRVLDTLDRLARRHHSRATPHGDVVWRSWGSGPPLVLLHGGAGSWMHWVRNIEALARSHTLWVPDLPGMGESDLPREGLDADTIAPIVLSGAAELLGDARFDLVGFSFGSLVAGHIAHLAPAQVGRLVLVAATGLGFPVAPSGELRSLRGVTDPLARDEVLRHNLSVIMIHDRTHIDALAVAVQDRSAQRDRVRDRKLARSDVMLRIAPTWQCPVVGIWGHDDNTRRYDPERFDSAVARLGLQERHVIPNAGHWVNYEAPDVFNPLLLRVLA